MNTGKALIDHNHHLHLLFFPFEVYVTVLELISKNWLRQREYYSARGQPLSSRMTATAFLSFSFSGSRTQFKLLPTVGDDLKEFAPASLQDEISNSYRN